MTKAFDCAVRLLSRREHGERELINKLMQKGFDLPACQQALQTCQELGLQSDARFVEAFCNTRIRQGYGPLRISQELQSRCLDRELVDTVLSQYQDQWDDYALAVWQKKYKAQAQMDVSTQQKQQGFLRYRGFYADTIARLFKTI